MRRAFLLPGLWVLLMEISGCIVVGGTSSQPTRGQELIDLKAALDRGAITQAEYDSSKAQIINRH
jgi:hypothetical protein